MVSVLLTRAEGSVGGDNYVYSVDRGDGFTENAYTLISRSHGLCTKHAYCLVYQSYLNKGFETLS